MKRVIAIQQELKAQKDSTTVLVITITEVVRI